MVKKKVFVSSVVDGMENYRQVARDAISVAEHEPLMSEDFSARGYSPQVACQHGVEQCDILLLIVGQRYGQEGTKGLSVTREEYRKAKESNKLILAFIQRVESRDPRQDDFLNEIEAYVDGLYRTGFSSEMELNNKIIKALLHANTMSKEISEEDLRARFNFALNLYPNIYNEIIPQLYLIYLPLEESIVKLASIERNIDHTFAKLCKSGVMLQSIGYKSINNHNIVGIASDNSSVYFCEDGLIMLTCTPTKTDAGFFSHAFAVPDIIANTAKGFFNIIDNQSGYVHLALHNMQSAYVSNPTNTKKLTYHLHNGKPASGFTRKFTPLATGIYNEWVDSCVEEFEKDISIP